MPFNGPGPGRPKGGLNKTTIEVRDAARALVDDAEYRKTLRLRVINGLAPHMETLLWHYAYGKPKETIAFDPESPFIAEVRSIVIDPKAKDTESKDTDDGA